MRRRLAALGAPLLASSLVAACAATAPSLDPGESMPGGGATTQDASRAALEHEVLGLDEAQHAAFVVGDSFTTHDWVSAPASASSRDGLGPLYNATRCSACHARSGRGRPADEGGEMLSSLVRLSVAGADAEPTYGAQLQTRAILGVPPEAATLTRWIETRGAFADGTPLSMRAPRVDIVSLAYGPMAEATLVSVRTAPALVGLGLLEAIPDAALLANEDPDDADHDGISGRASRVWDAERGAWRLGRFGWKASMPDVRTQTAAALAGDMGITSVAVGAQPCTEAQRECAAAPDGGEHEASDLVLDAITLYQRAREVPARRDASDARVLRGRELFHAAQCASCHVPSFVTGPSDVAALAGQQVWPYTDLLLHDMGEGLADGRPDHAATGREWRTPPLWAVGLAEVVSGEAFYLHDGRARDVTEAILWHDGEAEAAREAFVTMSASDRDALVRFVRSL